MGGAEGDSVRGDGGADGGQAGGGEHPGHPGHGHHHPLCNELSRRSVKQVKLRCNPLWIFSHPPPRRICTNLIPCLRYQNLMTFSKNLLTPDISSYSPCCLCTNWILIFSKKSAYTRYASP